MCTKEHPWQRCYLHGNHRFMSPTPTPRTTRQAFGHQAEFNQHRKADTFVVVFVVLAMIAALVLRFLEGV